MGINSESLALIGELLHKAPDQNVQNPELEAKRWFRRIAKHFEPLVEDFPEAPMRMLESDTVPVLRIAQAWMRGLVEIFAGRQVEGGDEVRAMSYFGQPSHGVVFKHGPSEEDRRTRKLMLEVSGIDPCERGPEIVVPLKVIGRGSGTISYSLISIIEWTRECGDAIVRAERERMRVEAESTAVATDATLDTPTDLISDVVAADIADVDKSTIRRWKSGKDIATHNGRISEAELRKMLAAGILPKRRAHKARKERSERA